MDDYLFCQCAIMMALVVGEGDKLCKGGLGGVSTPWAAGITLLELRPRPPKKGAGQRKSMTVKDTGTQTSIAMQGIS